MHFNNGYFVLPAMLTVLQCIVNYLRHTYLRNTNLIKCELIFGPAERKGPSVGIFISKKMRFYKAVQNFPKKCFHVNLLINIVYYVYIDLYIM